ncbi:hsp90-like protein [Xylariaceae sp. FL0255]|nr:hsp90-like protein [Xylariaceae sp. FL0255]
MHSSDDPPGSPSLPASDQPDETTPTAPQTEPRPDAAAQPKDEAQEPADDTTPIPSSGSTRPTALPVSAHDLRAHSLIDGQIDREPSITSSWSATSDHQLGYATGSASSNADPSDRVFPIRSVVSVDPSQPGPRALARNPTEIDYFTRTETTWNGRRSSISRAGTDSSYGGNNPLSPTTHAPPTRRSRKNTTSDVFSPPTNDDRFAQTASLPLFIDTASDVSDQSSTRDIKSLPDNSSQTGGSQTGAAADVNDNYMTVRFKHIMTEDGHAVITGRDGTLQRCEDEPIQTPGAVQSFGLLVALREEPDGRLSVRIVSENSKKIIGYSPQELFRTRNFLEIFSEQQADTLLDHIDFIRDEESDPAINGPDVFSISVRPPKMKQTKLWCAIHLNASHPDLIICEFEPEDDQEHPIRPPDELLPDEPEDTLYQNPTAEEFHESTEIGSKPLRVLRSARKRRGEAGAMQVFDIMSQVQEQLASAPNLDKFLKILVGIVKELTGFHRVMIYQFDAEFNGKVVTEVVDPVQTRDLYHGLHFPASDIPRQARELYKLNKVRLLYDRDLESARLVCRTTQDLEQPLDLSHAYLRAMSPIHLKYLGNMAVRSSMSISINAFNELWGLIACHSYGRHGMRVPFPIRKMCRLVGDTACRNIERLSYASRLQARKLINTMPTDNNPSGYIVASSDDLLKLFDADFGMLSIRDETKVLGKIEQSQEALAMLEYLRLRSFTSVLTTQDIAQDFPDLRYPPGFAVIAGLLYIPLSVGGSDFIVFFRKGQAREVKWAGNPYDKIIKQGTANYLEPRSSFKVWHETVIGKCREWSEEQVETAAVLCLVYGKFIEVWRQKEAALQSSRLTKLLLAKVRTPLNHIINYLEIALEGSLDHETRENLSKSHSASKSLIYVINDLLDLTQTEEGKNLVKDEVMDLPACIIEATDPFKIDAKRKGISYEVMEHPGLPRFVHGDYRRVRQAVANMTANAVQNTAAGSIKVESFVTEVLENRVTVEIAVHDTGCGMSNEKLDSLFQDLEQVSSVDFDESKSVDVALREAPQGRTLGLGLAVIARIVRNMDGQLRLKSEEGKGSRFVIQLPFLLPDSESAEKASGKDSSQEPSSKSTRASVTKSLPPTQSGEVMLVDRGGPTATAATTHTLAEKRSFEETNSISSVKSGVSNGAISNKSDAERLIDAIQTPLSLREAGEGSSELQRRSSKRRSHQANNSASSLPGVLQSSSTSQHAAHEDDGERPKAPSLRRSTTGPIKHQETQPGVHFVADSRTPVKPVKVPDEYVDQPTAPQTGQESKVLFEIPQKGSPTKGPARAPARPSDSPVKLRVLIAEDDPVNMKILKKRLEKSGHEVYHAVNGEDCATVYKERPSEYDTILMDMQMPIVDGLTSTKLIRAFEKSDDCKGLSTLAGRNGRIPILAVSASLVEKEKTIYTETGFDGWILKPIDFKRLNVLLEGITSDDIREQCLYKKGEWERGGWFARRPEAPHRSDNSAIVAPKKDGASSHISTTVDASTEASTKDGIEATGESNPGPTTQT